MPQFYFHLARRGDLFEDRDGWHYSDIEPAVAYGWRLARDLRGTGTFTAAVVLVVDALGQEVARIPVDNVVDFARPHFATGLACGRGEAEPDQVRPDAPRSGE